MKMHAFWLASGVGLGMIIQACATTDLFPYPSYGVNMSTKTLLADTTHGLPDLPLEICDATPQSQSPCIAFMTADYLRLKADHENHENQLVSCQKQLSACQGG